jgi:predicted AlkP superfamily phosphohydrolase/phosphomutase
VQRIIDAVGVDSDGKPNSNIIVVSDHGFDIFHTAVNMTAFLASQGFEPARVRAITSGSAVNLYINLQGREPNGTVSKTEVYSTPANTRERAQGIRRHESELHPGRGPGACLR